MSIHEIKHILLQIKTKLVLQDMEHKNTKIKLKFSKFEKIKADECYGFK